MRLPDGPGSNLDRLRRMQAERRRAVVAPPMVRALDRTLSIAERRAALEEASPGRHIHPGGGWHSHPGPRYHEHRKP